MMKKPETPYDHLWALLWSKEQGFMHIEPLLKLAVSGFRQLWFEGAGPVNDYMLIAIGDREEIEIWADLVRPKVHALGPDIEQLEGFE